MSETYIITAKTVDEAIAIANREYADADHEVAYDIIDMPKKGIFGIGARDAKIKITVSKVQKVELGSLVDDIRSMKTLTDRGGSRTPEKKTKPAVNVTAQNSAKPAQNGQKPTQNAQTQKSAKPAQPKQNQPKTEKSAEKPVQKKPVENAQPKSDKLAQQKQQNQQKPAQKPAEKPQNQNQQKPKAEAKPEAKPVENKPVENKPVEAKQKPAQPKSETKVEAKTEPVQTTEAKAEKTYTSHLGNEVKRTRRPERKPQHTENIAASGVTVSSPVGLSDFSGTKNGGFGSGDYKSGRISNDIKKKPALQGSATKPVTDPAKANRDALKALTFDVDAHEKAKAEEAAPATAPATVPVVTKAEKPQRPAKPARQNKPQQKPAEKAQPKEEKYPESTLVKTDAQPAADASAEKRLREGVTQAEMDYALDFANTLLENMKLDAKAVPADANGDEYIINGDANVYPRINIIGADTGILIGHHGETLDAIQYLVNLSALRKSKQKDGDYVKIVVDIEGYREKREETLRTLARRMAARAVKYKRNVFLEPMNAYERRIIHSELQSFENVSTHSVGADKDRKIIITYEGPDKRERPDRRRAQASAVDTTAVDANAVAAAEATDAVETDSVKNEERRRPKKPVKLPIDKLTDLLESREDNFVTSDNCTAPAISEDAADAVSETEEAKQLVETEAEVGAIPEYVGEEAEAEADEAVEAEEADETEEASEEETEKENDLADEEE